METEVQSFLEGKGEGIFDGTLLPVLSSAALGVLICMVYRYLHGGRSSHAKFSVSLAAIAVLTGTLVSVTGESVALSLAMAGLLAVLRFRMAIRDSTDGSYIFWAVAAGLCCGAGRYFAAVAGSAALFALLLLLGRIRDENRVLLVVRAIPKARKEIEDMVASCYGRKAQLRVQNTTLEGVELIYEMSGDVCREAPGAGRDITEILYQLGGVEYVNLVFKGEEPDE